MLVQSNLAFLSCMLRNISNSFEKKANRSWRRLWDRKLLEIWDSVRAGKNKKIPSDIFVISPSNCSFTFCVVKRRKLRNFSEKKCVNIWFLVTVHFCLEIGISWLFACFSLELQEFCILCQERGLYLNDVIKLLEYWNSNF